MVYYPVGECGNEEAAIPQSKGKANKKYLRKTQKPGVKSQNQHLGLE